MQASSISKHLAFGAAAGAAATIPMSWAMEVMHQFLPAHQRYALPPRQITERVTGELGLDRKISQEQRLWLAMAAHLGYGAAVGAIYAAGVDRHTALRPLVKGTAYGLAVWAGSYLGLLPALGILTPATRHHARRNALMIAAHVVWGSAVGIFTDLLESGREREHPEFLGAGRAPGRGGRQREMEHA